MPVQKKTHTKATKATKLPAATSTAATDKGGAKALSAEKTSNRDTLKKATPTKKSSSATSTEKKSLPAKDSANKSKPSIKKPVTPKTSALKSVIKKPAATKKASKAKKSTSELLQAIKALDTETLESTDLNPMPQDAAIDSQSSTKSKGKSNKPVHLPIVPTMQKAVEIVAPSTSGKIKIRKASFGKKDLDTFRDELLLLRNHFTHQTKTMMHDALQREDGVSSEEDGTDAFMRLQVLNQMGNQQRMVTDIDEALNDIESGTYGICEMCECLISKLRLKARPFARFCIKCKSEMERADRFNKPR